ncbi:MAG: STAS domain-containing protein [Armatimonadetes bacterium]|nr:STAS domain-containing protein [Armatimonadota bacterium]
MPSMMKTVAPLKIERPSPECLVVGGEVDLSNAPLLKSHLDEWLSGGLPSYTLDLRPTRIIDSSGLGLVVGAYRRVVEQENPKADFQVIATGPVLHVIRLIGLDRVIPVVNDEL